MIRAAAYGFPWLEHRSLAQVARTDHLLRERDRRVISTIELDELAGLLIKAERHNPPAEPEPERRA